MLGEAEDHREKFARELDVAMASGEETGAICGFATSREGSQGESARCAKEVEALRVESSRELDMAEASSGAAIMKRGTEAKRETTESKSERSSGN